MIDLEKEHQQATDDTRKFLSDQEQLISDTTLSNTPLIVAAMILHLSSFPGLYLSLRDNRVTVFSEVEIREQYDKNLQTLEDTQQNLTDLLTYIEGQSNLVW